MEEIEKVIDDRSQLVNVLEVFSNLEENERRRFSWVAPKESDLKWLKEYFVKDEIDRLIGIGCGSGFLERIIADYCGLKKKLFRK